MKNKKIWAEGRWVDIWSINHTLFGIISAYIFTSLFPGRLAVSFGLALAVYIVWEIFEKIMKVGEYPTNQLMDVVVSIIGFGLYLYIPFVREIIILIMICFVILELFGYATKFKMLRG